MSYSRGIMFCLFLRCMVDEWEGGLFCYHGGDGRRSASERRREEGRGSINPPSRLRKPFRVSL